MLIRRKPLLRFMAPALALAWHPLLCAMQDNSPARPLIVISEVGGSRVDESRLVNLHRQVINVFGYARNCQNGELMAMIKPAGESKWHLFGPVKADVGGVFQIDEIRLPEPGDYAVHVALFAPGTHLAGTSISETQLTQDALTISRSVNLSISAPSRALLPPEAREYQDQSGLPDAASLEVLAVGHRTVQPDQSTVVEASGDVLIAVRNLPSRANVYLALHAPQSEICYIQGPAIFSLQGNYVLPGVSFVVPGNPLQLHLEVLAFVSRRSLPPGAMNWNLFQGIAEVISRPFSITVEAKPPQMDTRRIPVIRIDRIDDQNARYPAAAIRVHQGAAIEVSYQGLSEGTHLWVLTRTRGTHAWLTQGPMQMKMALKPGEARLTNHQPTAEYANDDLLAFSYLWPDLRFQYLASHPDTGKESEHGSGTPLENNFDVMVVASTLLYPNGWIDSAFISLHAFDSVSQILHVQVDRPEPRENLSSFALSISSVAGKEIGSETITEVSRSGPVVVETGLELPYTYQLYVCSHPLSQQQWSCFEGIRKGNSYVAPDLPFSEPLIREGTPYQLLAFASQSPLPSLRGGYTDFTRYADAVSEPVTVQVASPASLLRWLAGLFAFFGPPGDDTQPFWRPMLLLVFLLLLLVFALLLLEWLFKTISTLSGSAATMLDRARAALWKWNGDLPKIDLARFLLGVAIFATLLYVIFKYYVVLYIGVLSTVFGFSKGEALGMSVWLIFLTTMLGLLIDLAIKAARQAAKEGRKPPLLWLLIALLLAFALSLWVFEGYLYYSYLLTLSKDKFSLVPAMGGLAFALIAMVLTAAFFVVTELVLEPAGLLLGPFLYFLLSIFYLAARLVEQLFLPFPKRNDSSRYAPTPPAPGPETPERIVTKTMANNDSQPKPHENGEE